MGADSTQLMVCALALDPHFIECASHMVTDGDDRFLDHGSRYGNTTLEV